MRKRNYLITFVWFNNSPMSRFITISKGTEFLRIPADHLVFISADGNYSNVVTRDGKSALVSFQLGQVEDLIADQLGDGGGQFIRLGRGLIINIHFVYRIDIATQQLVLSDCNGCYHEQSASREVLIKLKAYMETFMKLGNE